jgi:hypothetical protein
MNISHTQTRDIGDGGNGARNSARGRERGGTHTGEQLKKSVQSDDVTLCVMHHMYDDVTLCMMM